MEDIYHKLAEVNEEIELLRKKNQLYEAEKELEKERKKAEKYEAEKLKAEEKKNEKRFSSEENKKTISLMVGMPIRHIYISDIWTGYCDGEKFIINNNYYLSPSGLGSAHIKDVNSTRKNYSCNGWYECEVYHMNKWIKLSEFRKRIIVV